MIGVALKSQRISIIKEFFELFKTPWEFFTRNRKYTVIISDQTNFIDANACLIILLTSADARKSVVEPGPVILRSGEYSFPIFLGTEIVNTGTPLVVIDGTDKFVGSRYRRKRSIVIQLGYSFFEEASFLLTVGQRQDFARYPTLDIHIANLRRWILEEGLPLVEVPPVPFGGKFFACLTHDVDFAGLRNYKFDRTAAGFLGRALFQSVTKFVAGEISLNGLLRNWVAVAEVPLVYLEVRSDYWATFSEYRKLEADFPSTFFFIPFKDRPGKLVIGNAPKIRAVKYEVSTLADVLLYLIESGCEIGVHGIDGWLDVEKGKEELNRIDALVGYSKRGVRMHWLYFNKQSPEKLEKAGYEYDSSWGYNDAVGFKAGTLQVFKPLDVAHLLELPMHVMDTALFYPNRLNKKLSEGIGEIRSLIATASHFGGVLTLNWHDRSIGPERFWDGVYCEAISELRRGGGLFFTAGAVVEWFRKRRSVAFEDAPSQGSAEGLRVLAGDALTEDRVFLRVYKALARTPGSDPAEDVAAGYIDMLLGNEQGRGVVV